MGPMSTRPRKCVLFPPCRVVSDHLCSPVALPRCVRCEPSPSSALFARCLLVWRALSARCMQAGATPIYAATQKGHLGVVTYLAGRGADVNAVTDVRFVTSLPCHLCACVTPSALLSPCRAVSSVYHRRRPLRSRAAGWSCARCPPRPSRRPRDAFSMARRRSTLPPRKAT